MIPPPAPAPTLHGTLRRSALVVVTAAALLAGLLVAPAPAQAAPSRACPGELVPATSFLDTRSSPHRLAIDCARWFDVVSGRSATSFAPERAVTRGQLTSMVLRVLDRGPAGPLPRTEVAGFDDTVGHLFETEIATLVELGVLSGVSATSFAPDAPVTRAQLASMVDRAVDIGTGVELAEAPLTFGDVGARDPHRRAIARLARAGIVSGTSSTTFAPGASVTREQAAAMLTRTAMLLVEEGEQGLPTARPSRNDAYASRMRAAWVHLFDDQLKTRAGIEQLVEELHAADATAIIAQVARRHDAYYRSDVLPRTADPRVAPSFDVLGELIDAAHARGLEVHAWYSIAPTWHRVYDTLPRPEGWLPIEHGLTAPVDQRWVTRTRGGAWSDYLDPGVPEVQDHLAAVVSELVTRYPVDGIHLDYVRYNSADAGYNPKALAAFQAERGVSGTPEPGDAVWQAWRRDQTRELVRRAAGAIEAAERDDVLLSAAVISWGGGPATPDRAGFVRSSPYVRTLQDWDRWVRDGELDAVMPMNYFRHHDATQRGWFTQWQTYQRALAADADVLVVPGPGGYLNHPRNAATQVGEAMRVDGASVYSYQQPTLDGSRGIWSRLRATRWGYHPQR